MTLGKYQGKSMWDGKLKADGIVRSENPLLSTFLKKSQKMFPHLEQCDTHCWRPHWLLWRHSNVGCPYKLGVINIGFLASIRMTGFGDVRTQLVILKQPKQGIYDYFRGKQGWLSGNYGRGEKTRIFLELSQMYSQPRWYLTCRIGKIWELAQEYHKVKNIHKVNPKWTPSVVISAVLSMSFWWINKVAGRILPLSPWPIE